MDVVAPVEETGGLTVRFLLDSRATDPRWRKARGLSYLVSTGVHSVLFDLGPDPAGLRLNLELMGEGLRPLDGLFLSHNHGDHVGGRLARLLRRPNLSALSVRWGAPPAAWAPFSCHLGGRAIYALEGPTSLLPGLWSTGSLPPQRWPGVPEHGLVAAVSGYGLVLLVGCAHPGIVRMVEHTARLLGRPVRAIVGGIHLHPPGLARRSLSRIEREAWETAAHLRSSGVERVAPSPHDSDPAALDVLEDAFGSGFQGVLAGGCLHFGNAAGKGWK